MSPPAIDELLQQATEAGVVPGLAATVVSPDGVLHTGCSGTLSVEDDRPVAEDTVFAIASMTKVVTSVAALQLLEQGRLALDQTVESIIPAFGDLQVLDGFDGDTPRLRPPARPATVQHLLTHTSGLGYWFKDPELLRWHELTDHPDPFTLQRRSIDTPLVCDPGERFEYGVSTDWLGQVVEAVSGQRLDAYLAEHVTGPLGMTDTGFVPDAAQRERLMRVHTRTPDGGLAVAPFEPNAEPELISGGGGGLSTLRDFGRFLRMLLRGGELDGVQILAPETADLIFSDHLDGAPLPEVTRSARPDLTNDVPALPFRQGWGLGLGLVLEDMPGMRRAGSGNWAGLFNCYFWVDRSSGIAAAWMTSLLPFFDQRVVMSLLGFEQAVYANLAAPAPA